MIGVCGGSASGKTTVANKIISELGVPWVTLLSMDSFYKVLNEQQHEAAALNEVRVVKMALINQFIFSTILITQMLLILSSSLKLCNA